MADLFTANQSVNATSVAISLPAIEQGLHTEETQLQWLISGYPLSSVRLYFSTDDVLSCSDVSSQILTQIIFQGCLLLLLLGHFADLHGHKKTFMGGRYGLWSLLSDVVSHTVQFFACSSFPCLFPSSFCRHSDAQHPEKIPGHRCCRSHSCLCKLSLALPRYPKNKIRPSARNSRTILLPWFSRALRGLCLFFSLGTSGLCPRPGSRSSTRSEDSVRSYSPSRSPTHVLTVGSAAPPGVHPSFLDLGPISSALLAVSCP